MFPLPWNILSVLGLPSSLAPEVYSQDTWLNVGGVPKSGILKVITRPERGDATAALGHRRQNPEPGVRSRSSAPGVGGLVDWKVPGDASRS